MLDQLRAQGFDLSKHVPFTREYRVACSCCEALCINGIATHERNCPNATKECDGCNETVSAHVRYCVDCQ